MIVGCNSKSALFCLHSTAYDLDFFKYNTSTVAGNPSMPKGNRLTQLLPTFLSHALFS